MGAGLTFVDSKAGCALTNVRRPFTTGSEDKCSASEAATSFPKTPTSSESSIAIKNYLIMIIKVYKFRTVELSKRTQPTMLGTKSFVFFNEFQQTILGEFSIARSMDAV